MMGKPESPLPPACGAKEGPCTVTNWAAWVEKTNNKVKMAANTHHDTRFLRETFMVNKPYIKPRKFFKG